MSFSHTVEAIPGAVVFAWFVSIVFAKQANYLPVFIGFNVGCFTANVTWPEHG